MEEGSTRARGDREARIEQGGPSPMGEKILAERANLAKDPAPGVTNRFVITESESWFQPLERHEPAPALAEMLLAILNGEPEDEEFVELADRLLADGRILLGHVLEGGQVRVDMPAEPLSPAARLRLREVFGHEGNAGGHEAVPDGEAR